MSKISKISITPLSMIRSDGLQKILFKAYSACCEHLKLSVFDSTGNLIREGALNVSTGENEQGIFLNPIDSDTETVWKAFDKKGREVFSKTLLWKKPREWTINVMISSHTDIGLHNSQYVQRYNTLKFIDKAKTFCDETQNRQFNDRYRYTLEGTWVFNNYPSDRGEEAGRELVENYIKEGKFGVCAGVAGNHTHTYGLEEMCRSTYSNRRMHDKWGIDTKTMTMIDNNGLAWPIVQPYCDAGIENIIFAPNQWNPLPSTVWSCDKSIFAYIWNPEAQGGGSRIDVRTSSELPMVFWWESADKSRKMLVWCSTIYSQGAWVFGFLPNSKPNMDTIGVMERSVANQLQGMDKRYPFDEWLIVSYIDDQEPDMLTTDLLSLWNKTWKWPQFKTLGNPNTPFEKIRDKWGDKIPVLRGDITGGWYQHPIAAPELLAQKLNVDRKLTTAEKLASFACLKNTDYEYPAEEFERAWDYLVMNDEHSYGTSGYKGRRVYETWMQHRDWIDKAELIADREIELASKAIGLKLKTHQKGILVFNPTANHRTEKIGHGNQYAICSVEPFSYSFISFNRMQNTKEASIYQNGNPPIVENQFYRLCFAENGAIKSVFDKELNRELLYTQSEFLANEIVYTKDNHKTFLKIDNAEFDIKQINDDIVVTVLSEDKNTKAQIIRTIILDALHKQIHIENQFNHISDMINNNRYNRYLYLAFPFKVENAQLICNLNGCEARYAKDVTGHGTDVYMAAHEWCCVENNDFGVALLQKDSQLVEFDHIHPDKTDFNNTGDGSAIFCYLANDWLQMHCTGGSHLNFNFRYSITSYKGNHKTAKIPKLAENFVNPLCVTEIGSKRAPDASFLNSEKLLEINKNNRLINVKRSENGNGFIVRLLGEADENSVQYEKYSVEACAIDESEIAFCEKTGGFTTWKIGKDKIKFKTRKNTLDIINEEKPADIGSVYTGLITEPRAACGENDGHLYLIWGQNMESNLSHYELYRSENPNFKPDESNLIAKVKPGVYRVALYEDRGLKTHTTYYYRVRAVNKNRRKGKISKVFSGTTKEIIL